MYEAGKIEIVSGSERRIYVAPGTGTSAAPTILLVEDDDQVRSFIRSLLRHEGYVVLEADTGRKGLEVAREHAGSINLLISDMLLPELSGYDLAEQLRSQYPDLKMLLMTGYVEGDIVQRSVGELGASFLDKPFQPAVLLRKVREAIGGRAEGNAAQ